jgi:hypothetical protein
MREVFSNTLSGCSAKLYNEAPRYPGPGVLCVKAQFGESQ